MRNIRLSGSMLVVSAIALFVLVFLIWASVAEVDEAVRAQGRAVPSGQTRVVQHLEGGIIAAIHMREGQRVRSGDRIYTIERSARAGAGSDGPKGDRPAAAGTA